MDCMTAFEFYLEDNSIDAIVTDPPYELGFMGKTWDQTGIANSVGVWSEALRVLKPGGYLLSFGGSRTYHRMACAVEDAGFEIRDQIMWVYGSGFPKSHNGEWGGTALKPAHEPIVMARKPLIGTVEVNWSKFGTGALNIDQCRVPGEVPIFLHKAQAAENCYGDGLHGSARTGEMSSVGRWPANLVHDGSDEVLEAFPQASGAVSPVRGTEPSSKTKDVLGAFNGRAPSDQRDGGGSAARFFYCAKASKSDRDEGLEGFAPTTVSDGRAVAADNAYQRGKTQRANTHPTVKPTDLMRYLCRLVTPAGGLVLDPFAGSGSTGKAAVMEGLRFIGIEREEAYARIANARIAAALRLRKEAA